MALDLENHLVARANEAFEPLTANFELTPLCNLHCDMCFIRLTRQQVEERGGLRDADSWLAIAQQLQQLNTLFILLTGGEPMSHPEFHRIYTTLRSMGFIMTLNTNGTLITEQMCRETFREKPRRVNVTLYGSNADTYERLCHNREGYERTVRGLRLLREHNIDTKLNLSMVRENSADYDEIMLLADELGIPVVSNSYMFPVQRTLCGRATHVVESRLPATDAAYFDNQWLRYKKGDEYDSFAKQAAHKGIEGTPAEEGYTLSCRAGRSSMWVSWQQHITPCAMMDSPCVDLATGATTPMNILENLGEQAPSASPALPAGDLSAAWRWIVESCLQLPAIDECKGCRLHHICQVCYAAAIHEKKTCGKMNYLCDMAHEELRLLQTPTGSKK